MALAPLLADPALHLNCVEGHNARILIIDDDPSYIFLCKRYLGGDTGLTHTIVSAPSVHEALAICKLDVFDCIIIDYRLPDHLGTDAIVQLRDNLGYAMPSTIILTSDGGEEAATEAVRSGATDFLTKRNVNQQSLCRAVRNAVEKARLRQSLLSRVNELEAANELLLRRNTEIQRFYHTVSHEVKTPLTAIQEFVSIVHDGLAGKIEEEQKTILNYALQSCDQIASHFNDLLELARFETGKMTIKLEPNSIHDVLDHCLVSATPAAISKGITLEISDTPNIPPVLIQPNRIIQVLSNLISNALKFTDSGGTVTIGCQLSSDAKTLKMSVTDTGCGLHTKDKTRIFERLYQVTPASDRGGEQGMGLGLSIASEIVALHGSRIEVESEPQKGSVFSFELQTQHYSESAPASA